ncbi:hypothetical protein H9P43_003811 [Blastocladiella emersonii ATCC 22665]|nr:hypothetical protein H9P43_003811 [Blastocladiella emersonii ATCC 22665]
MLSSSSGTAPPAHAAFGDPAHSWPQAHPSSAHATPDHLAHRLHALAITDNMEDMEVTPGDASAQHASPDELANDMGGFQVGHDHGASPQEPVPGPAPGHAAPTAPSPAAAEIPVGLPAEPSGMGAFLRGTRTSCNKSLVGAKLAAEHRENVKQTAAWVGNVFESPEFLHVVADGDMPAADEDAMDVDGRATGSRRTNLIMFGIARALEGTHQQYQQYQQYQHHHPHYIQAAMALTTLLQLLALVVTDMFVFEYSYMLLFLLETANTATPWLLRTIELPLSIWLDLSDLDDHPAVAVCQSMIATQPALTMTGYAFLSLLALLELDGETFWQLLTSQFPHRQPQPDALMFVRQYLSQSAILEGLIRKLNECSPLTPKQAVYRGGAEICGIGMALMALVRYQWQDAFAQSQLAPLDEALAVHLPLARHLASKQPVAAVYLFGPLMYGCTTSSKMASKLLFKVVTTIRKAVKFDEDFRFTLAHCNRGTFLKLTDGGVHPDEPMSVNEDLAKQLEEASLSSPDRNKISMMPCDVLMLLLAVTGTEPNFAPVLYHAGFARLAVAAVGVPCGLDGAGTAYFQALLTALATTGAAAYYVTVLLEVIFGEDPNGYLIHFMHAPLLVSGTTAGCTSSDVVTRNLCCSNEGMPCSLWVQPVFVAALVHLMHAAASTFGSYAMSPSRAFARWLVQNVDPATLDEIRGYLNKAKTRPDVARCACGCYADPVLAAAVEILSQHPVVASALMNTYH